jgi:hypothetical protein
MIGIGVNLFSSEREGGAGIQQVPPPSGFDWTPPINIYREGTTYSTDFVAADWKIVPTATVWVSTTGNNATGTGSQAQPWREVDYALTQIALLPDTDVQLNIVTGTYTFGQGFAGQTCNKNINFIPQGGRVQNSNKFPLATGVWTLDGTGTYKATRSTIVAVTDALQTTVWPDGAVLPKELPLQASLAACQALPGSWYTDNVTVWVHRIDGSVPDGSATGPVSCIFNTAGMTMGFDVKWYVENVDFIGATSNCVTINDASMSTNARLLMVDCTGTLQNLNIGKTVAITGVPLTILKNFRVYGGKGDGLNYHIGATNAIDPKAIEIDCHAYNMGTAASDNTYNCTTSHENARVVRINGHYSGSIGPVMADVTTAQTWNLGCAFGASTAGSADSQDASAQTMNTAKAWLDGCTVSGSHYDLYAGNTSQIRYRNMTVSGLTFGNVGTY